MISPDAESIWFTFRTEGIGSIGKHVDERCTVYCNLKAYDGSDPKLPIIKVKELDKNSRINNDDLINLLQYYELTEELTKINK